MHRPRVHPLASASNSFRCFPCQFVEPENVSDRGILFSKHRLLVPRVSFYQIFKPWIVLICTLSENHSIRLNIQPGHPPPADLIEPTIVTLCLPERSVSRNKFFVAGTVAARLNGLAYSYFATLIKKRRRITREKCCNRTFHLGL